MIIKDTRNNNGFQFIIKIRVVLSFSVFYYFALFVCIALGFLFLQINMPPPVLPSSIFKNLCIAVNDRFFFFFFFVLFFFLGFFLCFASVLKIIFMVSEGVFQQLEFIWNVKEIMVVIYNWLLPTIC